MAYRLAHLGLASLILPAVLALPSPHGAVHQKVHEKKEAVEWTTEVVYVTAGGNGPPWEGGRGSHTGGATAATTSVTNNPGPSNTAASTTQARNNPGQTSSASAASSSSGGGSTIGSNSGGAGIAFNYDSGDLSPYAGLSWKWNWAITDDSTGAPNAEYVPCVSATSDPAPAPSSAQHMLGFNEPDAQGITGAEAATQMAKLQLDTLGMSIGSPHPTSQDAAGHGYKWMEDYITSCKSTPGCQVDFLAFSWYANPGDSAEAAIKGLKYYLNNIQQSSVIQQSKLPLWFVELGWYNYTPPAEDEITFVQALPAIFEQYGVSRWAFYMAGKQASTHAMGSYGSSVINAYVGAS